jgi:hypothetical protein
LAAAIGANAASVDNPLLDKSFRVPFDRIGEANIEPSIASLLAQAEKELPPMSPTQVRQPTRTR